MVDGGSGDNDQLGTTLRVRLVGAWARKRQIVSGEFVGCRKGEDRWRRGGGGGGGGEGGSNDESGSARSPQRAKRAVAIDDCSRQIQVANPSHQPEDQVQHRPPTVAQSHLLLLLFLFIIILHSYCTLHQSLLSFLFPAVDTDVSNQSIPFQLLTELFNILSSTIIIY